MSCDILSEWERLPTPREDLYAAARRERRSTSGAGATRSMKLTNEQITDELQKLQMAVHEKVTLVGQVFPRRTRGKCLGILSLIGTVLRALLREVAFGTWQELGEEQIAGELQALQTAVEHVTDIVACEQIVGDLQALQTVTQDTALQEATGMEIQAQQAAVQEHFDMLRQSIQQLRLLVAAPA